MRKVTEMRGSSAVYLRNRREPQLKLHKCERGIRPTAKCGADSRMFDRENADADAEVKDARGSVRVRTRLVGQLGLAVRPVFKCLL